MHSLIGVVLPFRYDGDKLDEALREILAPFSEDLITEDGEYNQNGKWDWWQLGGRWTGIWSDYNPAADPANQALCWLCQGTGLRNDRLGQQQREQDPTYTCNGCGYDNETPSGVMVKHATQWAERPDVDVIPIAALLAKDDIAMPTAIASPGSRWIEQETWNGTEFIEDVNWQKTAREFLQNHRDCYIAAVDIHS